MAAPFNSILVDGVAPAKGDFRTYHGTRLRVRMLSVAEVVAADMSGVYAIEIGALRYNLDTADTTSAHDGVAVIVDSVGNRFLRVADSIQPGTVFTWDTDTADTDPGAGDIKADDATFASITAIYVDNLSAAGADVTAWLDSFDDRGLSSDRGRVRLQKVGAAENYIEAKLTGSVVDGTGYRKLTVSIVDSAGSFSASDEIAVSFVTTMPTVAELLAELGATAITVSEDDPSGGAEGALWFKVPAS